MTGNHLMLLLFSSVLSVCRDRCRVQQGCFIGNTIDIRLYRLSFLVGRIGVCPIPANNEGMARQRSSKFYYVSVLLDPVVYVHQRRSILRFGALHKRGHVYPAVVRLYFKLKVRSIGTSYGAGFIPTLRVCVKHIFPWKEYTTSNWPCLNKAFLSFFAELSDFCKCLCHS